MLNLIIGLFFVYLILSMLSSGIKEAISGWLRLRGKMLEKAIEQMLDNTSPEGELDSTVFKAFKDNQWFQSLERTKLTWVQSMMPVRKFPSYIKEGTFIAILLQALGSAAETQKVEDTLKTLKDGPLKTFLSKALNDAEGDISKFQKTLENWYTSTMAEVTTWYKHRSHTILFVIGFILASVLNADTFAIYHKLSKDPQVADQIADLADSFISNRASVTSDTLSASRLNTQVDSISTQLTQLITQDLAQVSTPLGLGWHKNDLLKITNINWLLMKLLGLLITSFALAMGASFWFNLLKNLLSWRSKQKSIDTSPTNTSS